MFLEGFYSHNFRNLASKKITFSGHLNILTGNNGQGKTNFLEAIYYLLSSKSFRTSKTENLFMEKESPIILKGWLKQDLLVREYLIEINSEKRKEFFIDQVRTPKIVSYLKDLFAINFSFNDFEIAASNSSYRRKVFDRQIFDFDRNYAEIMNKYLKLLEQKRALLKRYDQVSSRDHKNLLKIYDTELSSLEEIIVAKRLDVIFKIKKRLEIINNLFFQKKFSLDIEYKSYYSKHFGDLNTLKKGMITEVRQKVLTSETGKGGLIINLNNDDFDLLLNGKSLIKFGSQGEKKIAIFLLKFSHFENIQQLFGINPLILIDDMPSELDNERLSESFEFIVSKKPQIFITTTIPGTEIKSLPFLKGKSFDLFFTENGCITT